MHVRRPLLLLAFGLGVLGVIGVVGKLAWEHRKAQLEDAFHLLAVGTERLDQSDTASARQQFQESADRFRSLGRDPLMALHHAFAARLRLPAAPLRELRELSVPHLREGEAVLALALSEDSTLVAVTTRQRLLCLLIDGERWVEWELPQPIKSAGALHVDSSTGKMHVVIGDDGRLLTADCRSASTPLGVTASVTANQSAVAWFDTHDLMTWIAPAQPDGPEVKITARPLPGVKGAPIEIQVPFPGRASPVFPRAAVVHAIAKVDGNVLLFYGDTKLTQKSDLRDASVLVISIDEPKHLSNRMVFAAFTEEEEGGTLRWHSTRVRRLLPASAHGRVYALTEGPRGVAVLGSDARPVEVHADSLFSTDYRDGRETYDLSVKSSGAGAVMEVSRRGTVARLSYELPWLFRDKPRFAAISREGRHVVLASLSGDVLLIDISK